MCLRISEIRAILFAIEYYKGIYNRVQNKAIQDKQKPHTLRLLQGHMQIISHPVQQGKFHLKAVFVIGRFNGHVQASFPKPDGSLQTRKG